MKKTLLIITSMVILGMSANAQLLDFNSNRDRYSIGIQGVSASAFKHGVCRSTL